jgi:hypothetical protein
MTGPAFGTLNQAAQQLLSASFVAGPAINVQFMVKDSKRYAPTGGWGFAQFNDGKPADEAVHESAANSPPLRSERMSS